MRVVNLLWGFGTGGIVPVVENYCRHLTEFSMTLTKITFQLEKAQYDKTRLNNFGGSVILLKSRFSFQWISMLFKVCKGHDVLLCHGFNGTILSMFVKMVLSIRVVSTYHGDYHPNGSHQKLKAGIVRNLYHVALRYFVDEIVTVESYSKNELIRKGIAEEKIRVIYNALHSEPIIVEDKAVKNFDLKRITSKKKIILSICRLDKVKGLNYALLSLAKINSKVDWAYVIAGNGPEEQELKALAKSLGIEDKVFFLGYVSDPNHLYLTADIFLLPSLFEYHSISILEAMRAQKTIVSTKVGGTPESIENGLEGILVEHSSVTDLQMALMKVLDDTKLSKELALNARQKFEKYFTFEIQKAKVKELISR